MTVLYHGPCFLQQEYLFGLSHRKTCWITIVDIVGPKMGLLGDLEFHGHSYNFFVDINESDQRMSLLANRISRDARDNFMVHDVNISLV